MTNEEAIKQLEITKECDVDTVAQIKALDVAIAALRNHSVDTDKMVPLTLEQVRMRRGTWVWIVSPDKDLTVSGWAYIGKEHVFTYWEYERDAFVGRVVYNLCDYGAWLAYDHPVGQAFACAHRVWSISEEDQS